ncbi:NUDIX domain-containing protein [Brachybacterium huguangmaarense]
MLPRLPHRVLDKLHWWAVLATQAQFLVSVVALLRAPDGRILLVENRFWQGNRWGCPSGYMKHGETPERAARRECREETGVMPRDLAIARIEANGRRRMEIWVTGTVDLDAAPTALQRLEITRAALLAPEDALARMRRSQAVVVRSLLPDA